MAVRGVTVAADWLAIVTAVYWTGAEAFADWLDIVTAVYCTGAEAFADWLDVQGTEWADWWLVAVVASAYWMADGVASHYVVADWLIQQGPISKGSRPFLIMLLRSNF